MELFYCDPKDIAEDIIKLDDFEAKHLIKTLRKKVNDLVDVTDGIGNHFTGKIVSLKPTVTIQIEAMKVIEKPNQNILLGIGFIRPNRLEFVLEKCTELGVTSYFLFRSEHSNYFSDNKKRFEKILRQAIKQSNRFYIPKLQLCPSFDNFLHLTENEPLKLAAIAAGSPPLKTIFNNNSEKDAVMAIGPEGGFSEKEIQLLKEYKFQDVSLGNYRLRAETAAVAAISFLNINY